MPGHEHIPAAPGTRMAVVTGATGLVGRALVQDLVARDWDVRCLVRSPPRPALESRVQIAFGDLRSRTSLVDSCVGASAVFHCAALTAGDPDELHAVNVRGTEWMLHEARRASVRRFVFVSTVAAYRDGPLRNAHEDVPLGGSTPYAQTKQAAERLLARAASDLLSVAIVRASTVYGRHDRSFVPTLLEILTRYAIPVTPSGGARLGIVHADDLADALVRAAEEPVEPLTVVNVSGPPPITVRELATGLAKALDLRVALMMVPEPETVGPNSWADLAASEGRPLMPTGLIPVVLTERTLDTTKAREVLSWSPRIPHVRGLADILRRSLTAQRGSPSA